MFMDEIIETLRNDTRLLAAVAGTVLFLRLCSLAVFVVLRRALWKEPENSPLNLVKKAKKEKIAAYTEHYTKRYSRRIALLGDNQIHATLSYRWQDHLAAATPDTLIINAGRNFDLAYHAHHRWTDVAQFAPTDVVIALGCSDVVASHSPYMWWLYRFTKWNKTARALWRRQAQPDLRWFREYIENLVLQSQQQTKRVAIASIAPLGEDLESPLNRAVRRFNAVLHDVAQQYQLVYLPVYENIADEIHAHAADTASEPAQIKNARPGCMTTGKALFALHVRRKSHDDVATRLGFFYTIDGMHLNRRGAAILSRHVEQFLL